MLSMEVRVVHTMLKKLVLLLYSVVKCHADFLLPLFSVLVVVPCTGHVTL
jgi:hypothetical protein